MYNYISYLLPVIFYNICKDYISVTIISLMGFYYGIF